MRPTSQRHQNLHQSSLAEFDRVQAAMRDERLQCLKDRRFYSIAGAQWEGPLADQFANQPKLEVNKIHLAVIRIINEYRANRISVNFLPKNGVKDDALSDAANGLYRADEEDSVGEEAFDNGFEEAVGGGFGAMRVRSTYEDEEDEEDERQRIRIEPIPDADSSVFFNLGAKRQDKADAKRCWVLSSYTIEDYKDKWKDDPASWPKSIHQWEFDWATPDVVFVAEFYEVEFKKETTVFFKGLDNQEESYTQTELDEDPTIAEKLTATGFKPDREKVFKRRRVHKYIESGSGILEDCGYIAGPNIPIIPTYGKRWFVDNVERCMGHVRLPTDTQRLKNMQTSRLAEISAQSSVEKPIVTPAQMKGHALMWSQDNIKRYPYLFLNLEIGADGTPLPTQLQYTKVPNIPPALAALLQLTDMDMKELLGNQEAGEQIQSNMSGVAVELVQNKLDMQTFIYISNMRKAVKRVGEVWWGMAQEVYVEPGRKMKTIDDQGEVSSIELMRPIVNEKTSATEYENDLSQGKFDVIATVGPASASRRAATVRALTGMMQLTQDPDDIQVLTGMAMMNMEGEGIENVRGYYRKKMIKKGVVKPTDEEAAELQQAMANQPPDPNAVFLEAEATKARAQAAESQSKTELNEATTKKTLTEAMATIEKVGLEHERALMSSLEMLGSMYQEQTSV